MLPVGRNATKSFQLLAATLSILSSGCSDSVSHYYPLETGLWWDYRIHTTILDKPQHHRVLISNLGMGVHHGRKVYIQRRSPATENYLQLTPDAILRVHTKVAANATDHPPESIVMPANVEVGYTWMSESRLTLILSRTIARQDKLRRLALPVELTFTMTASDEIIEASAGRFEHCIKIDATGERFVPTDRSNARAKVSVHHSQWYAPGVGLVKSERNETSDSTFLIPGYYSHNLLRYGQ